MIDMYFTDMPELRKLEREIPQKPNFDRRNDNCDENDDTISLITKMSIQTEIGKTEIDFMTIKIRSPTKAIT